MCLLSFPQVVNSQWLNFTLVSEFTYKCGLGRCKILSEYCDDDGSGTAQCSYCNIDVCNSDPHDYPDCKLACDYQFNKKSPVMTTLTSTMIQTSTEPQPYNPTTIPSHTVLTNHNLSDKESEKIYIILGVCLALSVLFNVVLIICCCRLSSKRFKARCVFAQKKADSVNNLMKENDASYQCNKDETIVMEIDNKEFVNDSEHQQIQPKRVQELQTHRRNHSNTSKTSVKTTESGYLTLDNTPQMERKPSQRTERNDGIIGRNETHGGSIIANPQAEASYKVSDGVVSPSGS